MLAINAAGKFKLGDKIVIRMVYGAKWPKLFLSKQRTLMSSSVIISLIF